MQNKKLATILILTATVLLAGVALFTAVKLYQIGQEDLSLKKDEGERVLAPDTQKEIPFIAQQEGAGVCELTFNIGGEPSPSPSDEPSPTPSEEPSQDPSPNPECWEECNPSDNDCSGSLECQNVSGVNRCVNPSCSTESDCQCPGTSSSPSPTPGSSTPPTGGVVPPTINQQETVPTQKLPEAGIISPTLIFSIGGLTLLVLGLLL